MTDVQWLCEGGSESNRYCHRCMTVAEQMAKDYEPPKPHSTYFRDGWVRCWGMDGHFFDRNCPDCVKAAEELAKWWYEYTYPLFQVHPDVGAAMRSTNDEVIEEIVKGHSHWPTRGHAIMTGAQLSELEKRAYNRGFNAGYDSALQGSKDDIQLRIDSVNGIRKGLGIT